MTNQLVLSPHVKEDTVLTTMACLYIRPKESLRSDALAM